MPWDLPCPREAKGDEVSDGRVNGKRIVGGGIFQVIFLYVLNVSILVKEDEEDEEC